MKKILITGGTGSFGNAMVARLLEQNLVEQIVIFSRDELKQHNMRLHYENEKLLFIVGDVRDKEALRRAMIGVDVVFHAAALKQVPTGEYFPMELVMTNVLGTQNVLDMAEVTETVKKVIFLSTDKAAYPINTMGLTKGLAEHLVTGKGYSQTDTIFCSVRYGNVMGSRGSVIPLFVEKLLKGGDLPVTDPKMTRFLLSLEDAIDLVLLAIEKGEQGDLFIKKAPAATMGVLSQALVEIFNSKSSIKIVGTRAGEKIHETLATQLELLRAEDLGGHYRIKSQIGLKPEDFFDRGVSKAIQGDYTSENTEQLSLNEVKGLLLTLNVVKEGLEN